MSRRHRCRRTVAATAFLVTFAFTVFARDDTAIPTASLGIGGTHRTGEWTPLTVHIPTPIDGVVRLSVEDPDGQFLASPPAIVSENGRNVRTSVRPGRPAVRVRVLLDEHVHGDAAPRAIERLAASLEIPSSQTTPSTTPLMLLAGTVPAAPSAARLVAGDGIPMHIVPLDSARMVAAGLSPRDLDAFDAAVVCGNAVAGVDDEVVAAIDAWVRRGGRLVFASGVSAIALVDRDGSAARWLPGSAPRLVPLRRFDALESYARSGGLAARMPTAGIAVPKFGAMLEASGRIDVFEGPSAVDLPLVVRRAHGFGTITWIAVDLDERWCANWPGCDRLLAALLGGRSDSEQSAPAVIDTSLGIADLASQFRVGLDTFSAAHGRRASLPVPFEVIAAVGIAYCLTLYPLDWWLVRRSNRPWLSWVTLPVAAGVFAAVSWGIGAAWGRDAPPRARAAEITDFDTASGLVRGSTWAAIRSPVNGVLDIGLTAGADAPVIKCDAAVSWFADRGTGFGGVDASTAHPSLAASEYAYGSSFGELCRVPIAAASSRLFEAGWTAEVRGTIAESSLLRDPRGLLTGRVVSRLPFAIDGCWLLHGGWLYDVGRLEPGETFDSEAGRGPRSLAAALTRRTAAGDRDRSERWDAAQTDVGRILEIAGFHDAAGADSYTGLAGGRLGRIDLSFLLAADRAILVGTVDGEPLASWQITLAGTETSHDLDVEQAAPSVVRVVLPVRTASVGTGSSP